MLQQTRVCSVMDATSRTATFSSLCCFIQCLSIRLGLDQQYAFSIVVNASYPCIGQYFTLQPLFIYQSLSIGLGEVCANLFDDSVFVYASGC